MIRRTRCVFARKWNDSRVCLQILRRFWCYVLDIIYGIGYISGKSQSSSAKHSRQCRWRQKRAFYDMWNTSNFWWVLCSGGRGGNYVKNSWIWVINQFVLLIKRKFMLFIMFIKRNLLKNNYRSFANAARKRKTPSLEYYIKY